MGSQIAKCRFAPFCPSGGIPEGCRAKYANVHFDYRVFCRTDFVSSLYLPEIQ